MQCPNHYCDATVDAATPACPQAGVSSRALPRAALRCLNVVLLLSLMLACSCKFRRSADNAFCQNNLKRLQIVLQQYAEKNRGMYPAMSAQPGVLMFSPKAIPPSKDTDPIAYTLTCPTCRLAERGTASRKAARMEPPPHDDQSYFYVGYAMRNERDLEAFAKAYRKQIAEGGTVDKDLVVQDDDGARVLKRLSEEVLRATQMSYSAPPYQSPGVPPTGDIPLLIERDLGHVLGDADGMRGGNVLYLHSGVVFVERGTWPMTQKTQRILAGLAD